MEIFTLLENLEEIIESDTKVPLSTKVMVDKEELNELFRGADFLSMGVVDPEVMDKIIELIEE